MTLLEQASKYKIQNSGVTPLEENEEKYLLNRWTDEWQG